MTLQQLAYFLAADREGSFSAAAERLHLAQPSLSEQVRRLEAELGVALFVRVGRGLVITEAGRALRPEAERAIGAADRARDAVAEARELRGGTATFGTFGSASHYLLSDLIADFRARHPDVRVRVIGQNSSEVAEAVRAGELEAALVVLPIDDRALEVRPAMRDEIVYASAAPARRTEPVTLEALARGPLILYDARWGNDDPTRRQLAERAQRAGVRLEPVVEVEELETALDLVALGVGDTPVPRAIVAGPRFPRGVGVVPFSEPLYDDFAFISRRGAPLSPASRAMVTLAERQLAAVERRLAAA